MMKRTRKLMKRTRKMTEKVARIFRTRVLNKMLRRFPKKNLTALVLQARRKTRRTTTTSSRAAQNGQLRMTMTTTR